MPNQPGQNTKATSFTLPKELLEALERKAKMEMTSQSNIIRRALMEYLPPEERQAVIRQLNGDLSPQERVVYKIQPSHLSTNEQPSSKPASPSQKALKKAAAAARRSGAK